MTGLKDILKKLTGGKKAEAEDESCCDMNLVFEEEENEAEEEDPGGDKD